MTVGIVRGLGLTDHVLAINYTISVVVDYVAVQGQTHSSIYRLIMKFHPLTVQFPWLNLS